MGKLNVNFSIFPEHSSLLANITIVESRISNSSLHIEALNEVIGTVNVTYEELERRQEELYALRWMVGEVQQGLNFTMNSLSALDRDVMLYLYDIIGSVIESGISSEISSDENSSSSDSFSSDVLIEGNFTSLDNFATCKREL